METTIYNYPKKKAVQLLELDKLLKFTQEILEGFIKPIEEEILVVTILGSTTSQPELLADKLISNQYGEEAKSYEADNTGNIFTFTDAFSHKSNPTNTKVIYLVVSGIEKKEFSNKILGMIHSISSIIILHTNKKDLSDLDQLVNLKKVFTGTTNTDDLIKNLSPKFIFSYISDKLNAIELSDLIEKNDNPINQSLVRYYKDRKFIVFNKNFDIETLLKLIFVDTQSKNYKGKKFNGLTLRNVLIEFVNCVNQGIGFNISKM